MSTLRIAAVLVAVVAIAGSQASNPPPQAMAPQSQPQAGPPASPQQYTPCEYACGQMARCQVAPYETCLPECRQTGAEQQPDGRQRLDEMAHASCEQLTTAATAASQPAQPPPPPSAPPQTPPSSAGITPAGRWISGDHVSVTNAFMTGADIFLDVVIADDGTFRGSWGRYLCMTQVYGIWSCGKGSPEGTTTGRLDANGTGSIDLANLGRTTLVWKPKSATEITLELPRQWQGNAVLFRSTLKR